VGFRHIWCKEKCSAEPV